MDTLQKLYDSEINACIFWNWDGGIDVFLGGGIAGVKNSWDYHANVTNMEEAESWLIFVARTSYPDSEFARGLK